MPINIKHHITHTNNTLILGELSNNPSQATPSLRSKLSGVRNWDRTIDEIFDGEDFQRLAVEKTEDVFRIFKPSYYFKVTEERFEGKDRIIVEHSSKYSKGLLEVPITTETLAFKILTQRGQKIGKNQEIDLKDQIKSLRRLLDRGRHDYLAATETGDPQRLKAQKELRRQFISRLAEPVITYLVTAEGCKLFTVVSDEKASSRTEGGEEDAEYVTQSILDFDEEGNLFITEEKIKINKPLILEKKGNDEMLVIARKRLEDDVYQGKKLVANVTKAYLSEASDKDDLPKGDQKFLESLTESGIGDEIAVDFIAPQSNEEKLLKASYEDKQEKIKLLEAKKDGSSEDNKQAPAEVANEDGEESNTVEEGEGSDEKTDKQASGNIDFNGMELLSPAQIEQLRDGQTPGQLKEHVENVRSVALDYYSQDRDKQNKIIAYLHTVTPVGRKENEIAVIRKQRDGEEAMEGGLGLEKYLELCLLEAREHSKLVQRFEEWIKNALLGVRHEITKAKVRKWHLRHDRLLQAAQEIFFDYMKSVAPVVSKMIGIHEFLKLADQAQDRKPRVLIANTDASELLGDDNLLGKFKELASKLNHPNQSKLERSLSIVIAPGLVENGSDELFGIAAKEGFSVFISPRKGVNYDDLNNPDEVENLEEMWVREGNKNLKYQSAVLCIPDSELVARGTTFTVGEKFAANERAVFKIDRAISVKMCYIAAGLVARNDDRKFVQRYFKTNGVGHRLHPDWPCLNLSLSEDKYKALWEVDFLSEGVTYTNDSEEPLPFCMFEHSKETGKSYNKQRMVALNSLCKIGNRPLPLHEFRQAKYLEKVLLLDPEEKTEAALKYFTEKYAGIWEDGAVNSILDTKKYVLEYDKELGYLDIKRIKGNQSTGIVKVGTSGEEVEESTN